ncbi:hypothetical protein PK35_12025 [Tamlana nanhaiensis]|uniref:Uncharacterized protein n=1 Tax=Neotamlana nanhaiensis TaxID=1382798 RepID=A0A0D7VZQ3_9FLAO|nr:hypothetical protein [Tamlana nanhaiensis]KJD32154.1 hypothetical protein PK35_11140 [Tamlana nanhaiensis]KJD32316.1 hypothetical protein PK35_12025 [Tamlana nanhaiensis]
MHDADFIFACGLEGGIQDDAHWFIRGPKITNGSESIEIKYLNLIMHDIGNVNTPYTYSGIPVDGESYNTVLRNDIEYTITAVTYSILEYNVINSNFSSYFATASGSYFIEIESPNGDKESILISFSPMLQTDYGGGC